MQDRFKFKVFDKEQNKIIDFNDFKKGDIEFNFNPDTQEIWIEYDKSRYIIIQCTGLKDKNVKLIYEGDIVYKKGSKNWKKEKLYSIVIYDDMYGHFNLSDENGIHDIPQNKDNIEVIGNIYENKELLEKNNGK